MSSLEEAIVDRLLTGSAVANLVDDRVFPDDVPSHTTPSPWIVYAIPSSEATDLLAANLDSVNTVEVSVFAESKATAVELANLVRDRLHKWQGGLVHRALWERNDRYDVDGGFVVVVSFRVWAFASG
jgi:hypothetical protein